MSISEIPTPTRHHPSAGGPARSLQTLIPTAGSPVTQGTKPPNAITTHILTCFGCPSDVLPTGYYLVLGMGRNLGLMMSWQGRFSHSSGSHGIPVETDVEEEVMRWPIAMRSLAV